MLGIQTVGDLQLRRDDVPLRLNHSFLRRGELLKRALQNLLCRTLLTKLFEMS